MLGDLFDSPWKILIIAAVVLVLFGSKKLPDTARSLGRSMRILKAEMKDLHEDDAAGGAQDGQTAQQLTAPAVGVPVVSATTAEGVPVAAPVAPVVAAPVVAAPVAPVVAAPESVPVPAEVQQDTSPA